MESPVKAHAQAFLLLLLLPPTRPWCCPSGPVCTAPPFSREMYVGNAFHAIDLSMSLLHHLCKCISSGTNETESHLIHFSEESLSFQVLGHLHPEKCLHWLFTNVQLFQPSFHFHGWPPRLSNKQGCKNGKEEGQKTKSRKGWQCPRESLASAESENICPLFSPRFQGHELLFFSYLRKLPLVVFTAKLRA